MAAAAAKKAEEREEEAAKKQEQEVRQSREPCGSLFTMGSAAAGSAGGFR